MPGNPISGGPSIRGPLTPRAPSTIAPIAYARSTSALAASLLAVAIFTAAAFPAAAADLSGSSRYDSPYDDPRYADIYGDPEPRRSHPYDSYKDSHDEPPKRHADDDDYDDDDARPPASFVEREREREREYLRPMRPGRRFAAPYRPERHSGRYNGCVPREEIKDRLRAEGWSDFHDLTLDGEFAIVGARRPSGRLFELEVHRCSGEVVNARPQRSQAHGRRRDPSRS